MSEKLFDPVGVPSTIKQSICFTTPIDTGAGTRLDDCVRGTRFSLKAVAHLGATSAIRKSGARPLRAAGDKSATVARSIPYD